MQMSHRQKVAMTTVLVIIEMVSWETRSLAEEQ